MSSFLSISDAADVLGVSRWTVGRLLDTGELAHLRVRGVPRIPRAALDAYIEAALAAAAAAVTVRTNAASRRPVGRPRKKTISQNADAAR